MGNETLRFGGGGGGVNILTLILSDGLMGW